MTVEEYIKFELNSERRHEFINGHLIEMPEEKDVNNEIAGNIAFFLRQHLKSKGFQIYTNDVKLSTPDRKKYYYPDAFVTNEEKSEENMYIKYHPELVVEVISPTTHITDSVDKYISYTSIPSLKYYLLVEPETVLVTVYFKNEDGEWAAEKYLNKSDVINFSLLELQLPLIEVYD